jgi:LPS-assembly lipoprotein
LLIIAPGCAPIVATLLLASAMLASCGFHPSAARQMPFQTLYIDARSYVSFAGDLRRYIASNGQPKLVSRPGDAQVVLQVLSETSETQILSLTTAGQVAEYLLRYRVAYRLHDNANKNWIPPSDIALQRDLTYDVQAVLAKEDEIALLFQSMRDDAVRQMMRRMSEARAPG